MIKSLKCCLKSSTKVSKGRAGRDSNSTKSNSFISTILFQVPCKALKIFEFAINNIPIRNTNRNTQKDNMKDKGRDHTRHSTHQQARKTRRERERRKRRRKRSPLRRCPWRGAPWPLAGHTWPAAPMSLLRWWGVTCRIWLVIHLLNVIIYLSFHSSSLSFIPLIIESLSFILVIDFIFLGITPTLHKDTRASCCFFGRARELHPLIAQESWMGLLSLTLLGFSKRSLTWLKKKRLRWWLKGILLMLIWSCSKYYWPFLLAIKGFDKMN